MIPEGRKPTWWWRVRSFANRHATVIAFVLLTAVAVGSVAGIRNEARDRAEAVEAEGEKRTTAVAEQAEQNTAEVCAESRNLRLLVSELIDTAVNDDGGGGLNLTAPASFAALPPSVQAYLRELVAMSAGTDDGPDLAERLRAFQAARLSDLPEFCT